MEIRISLGWLERISTIPYERFPKEKIRKIIKYAHEKKIKLLLGFGINSYGLKEIVQDNTELSAMNENGKKIMNVLCYSNPESLEWMKSILRYVISNYDIDGVELQSADQGRCMCKKCREKSNSEYHGKLNIEISDYIRSNWKDRFIEINTCGMGDAIREAGMEK